MWPFARTESKMARSKSKNVGIIGLGIIGSRIAATLRKRNFQVFVWNRSPKLEQNFVGSPAEVAELCDVVQLFVADDEALLEMVRQLSPALTAHHVITAHCTVAPESMRAAAELVQRRGARFLEAPFTGSKMAAENGQLVYYAAGDEAALKQVRPILEASSKEIVLIGDKIGDATVMKVATNLITAATAQVAAEALALVRKAGIAPELFTRAMKSNASNSTTLDMKVPMMMAREFEPHFSVKHMLKDVRIGLKLAENYRLHLPATTVSREVLLAEMKQGRGDADYASVAQRYFPAPGTASWPELEKVEAPKSIEEPAAAQEVAVARTEPLPEEKPAEAEAMVETAKSVAPSSNPEAADVEEPEEAAEPEPFEIGSKFTVMELLPEAEAAEVMSPEEEIESRHHEQAAESERAETAEPIEPEEWASADAAREIVSAEIPIEAKPAEMVAQSTSAEDTEEPKPIEAEAEFQPTEEMTVAETATEVMPEEAAESKLPEAVAESKAAEIPEEPKSAKPLTERLNIDALLKRIGLQKAFAAIGSPQDVVHGKPEIPVEPKPVERVAEEKSDEIVEEPKPAEIATESKIPEPAVESELAEMTVESEPAEPAVELEPGEISPELEPGEATTESKPEQKDLKARPPETSTETEATETPPAPAEPEQKPETKEGAIPEGVNLSGGFRGWLSRRFRSSSRREF